MRDVRLCGAGVSEGVCGGRNGREDGEVGLSDIIPLLKWKYEDSAHK